MAVPAVMAFVRAGFRLLTVQACFNHERMIGVGVGYASEPLLRTLPDGVKGDRYRAAMIRATRYFNAHPYLVGLAAGALARAEHDDVPGPQIERLRTALVGPLGAVGDRLVWAGTLPAASAVGLAISTDARAGLGALAMLGLYNVPHAVLRIWGLMAGWRNGTRVGRALASPLLSATLRAIGPTATLAIGFAIPLVTARLVGGLDLAIWTGVVAGAGLAIMVLRWIAPALGAVRLGLLAALGIALGAIL
ncbi:MAG: PTS system mannose/fructose/sorbose family transporter subunit IID [Gemmatimonadota bacterium]|nr:PTS system mannose/fructose/sorbose family transporter subunit IID [Gemmatimonadota bacterium]MDH5198665.1 PTS system mannose/fructose/sorbose family transporter subunit IID [Gemmatimonadota bacterium]